MEKIQASHKVLPSSKTFEKYSKIHEWIAMNF